MSDKDAAHNQIRTFDQFWLHYLRQHALPATRGLHFAGLIAALTFGALVLLLGASAYWLLVLPVITYGFAWSGHILSERNDPTTLRYPFWSFVSFFRMFRYWVMGRLPSELDRAGVPR